MLPTRPDADPRRGGVGNRAIPGIGRFNRSSATLLQAGGSRVGVGNRQRAAREYRGQIPSPGRPSVAWRGSRELRHNASTQTYHLEYRASLAQ